MKDKEIRERLGRMEHNIAILFHALIDELGVGDDGFLFVKKKAPAPAPKKTIFGNYSDGLLAGFEKGLKMRRGGLICPDCHDKWIKEIMPIHGIPDPAPPLNAQVAKCLGNNVFNLCSNWRMGPENRPPEFAHSPIPPYDKDRDLAMGALEEYCQANEIHFKIVGFGTPQAYYCRIFTNTVKGDAIDLVCVEHDSLPEAICQAIVLHAKKDLTK